MRHAEALPPTVEPEPDRWQAYLDAGATAMVEFEQESEKLPRADAPVDRGPDAAAEDAEWANFKRVKYDFIDALSYAPDRLKIDLMFRHPELNPADTYIPKSRRDDLRSIYELWIKKYLEIGEAVDAAAFKEFQHRKKEGSLRTVNVDALAKEHLKGQELAEYLADREKGHIVYYPSFFPRDKQPLRKKISVDGNMVFAFPEDLPISHQLLQMMAQARVQLAHTFLSFFGRNTALPESDQFFFLQQVAENVQ